MCLAVPGKIVSIEGETPLTRKGRVDFGGISRDINLAYVPDAKVGDYVLVHVGFALAVVDDNEAQRLFEYIESLEEGRPLVPSDHSKRVSLQQRDRLEENHEIRG